MKLKDKSNAEISIREVNNESNTKLKISNESGSGQPVGVKKN